MTRWDIRTRVLFLALAPSIMILLTLVGYFTYSRIAEVDVLLAQRGKSLARQLAPAAEFALFAGDVATLEKLAMASVDEADVAGVTITDGQGRVVAHAESSRPVAEGEIAQFKQPVLATRLNAADLPEQMGTAAGPAAVGTITVAMSRVTAQAHQRELFWTGLALGSASLLFAVALAVGIGNSVVRPIRGLAAAMASLTEGKPVSPLPAEVGGEFRTLNTGFNDMARELQAAARLLQARIDEATGALVAQKDAAVAATDAKSRFIAAASHDLRQPLHAIGLFTSTLQRRLRDPSLEPIIDDLAKAVSVMERLFDSLLDISKLDSGTLVAHPQRIALEPLFTQLHAEYVDAAVEKSLRLRIRPTRAVLCTDELLLHRLLANLVANAIRYTNSGSVLICCRRRAAAWQIEVRDSGVGIPPEAQSAIFQEFYQVGNMAQDRSAGLGLGLAIVDRIARLLGTNVDVRSWPGRGSVFSLRLPAVEGQPAAVPAMHDPPLAPPVRARPAVMVVDDDSLVLAGNRALLTEAGCDVATARDRPAAEAALLALGGRPVLVLCDRWLSDGLDGIDLLRHLMTLTTAPISGILISGDTRPDTIRAAAEAGFPLLHKPVSPERLRAVLAQFAGTLRWTADPGIRDEDTPR